MSTNQIEQLDAALVGKADVWHRDAHPGDHLARVVVDGGGDAEHRVVRLALVVRQARAPDLLQVVPEKMDHPLQRNTLLKIQYVVLSVVVERHIIETHV